MTAFDFTVIAILLVSSLLGLWRGLVYEVLSLLGWPIAFVVSKLLGGSMMALLSGISFVRDIPEASRVAVAYALVFIAALIVWGVLVWLIVKLTKAAGLGAIDKILGGLFGLLRGGMILLAVVWLAGLTHIPEQPAWRDAKMSKSLESVALSTKQWLPDNIAQRIHY